MRIAVACLLAWCSVTAVFSSEQIREYEYFPSAVAAEPPPLTEPRGEPNHGGIAVKPPLLHNHRWLRARVSLATAPAGVYALYVSGANRGATVFVNGVQVGSTSVSDAETFGWNYPIFFTIPPALLHAGENTLDLRLTLTQSGHGTIRGVELGTYAELKPKYDRILFWRVTGPQITTLIAVLLGSIALLMFARRHADTIYGWFAAAALLGALRNTHFFVSLPIGEWWYELWALVPLQWMCVALAMFTFRLCGQRFPRLERALLLVTVAWSIAPMFVHYVPLIDYGYLWLTLTSLGAIGYAAVQCWRVPKLERVLLLLALIVSQVFGLLDFALLVGLRAGESRVYLMPYSVLLFSVVVGAVLVDAFAKARVRQEQINRELDERLAARERELNATHQQVLALERERTMAGERQRILRDIHDGLGSQLVSSIQLVERGALAPAAVADVLRECVDDLRLAIDSLKPAGDDLLAVLGNFRYRMEPRLEHAGIRLAWHVDRDAGSPKLTSEQVLHILRIVQEAVANALKHAKPTCITLSFAQPTAESWVLEVGDDGGGFATDGVSNGDGLANMHARARRAGVSVAVLSSERGTVVRLESRA
jgi:signal transduction histidine kinase